MSCLTEEINSKLEEHGLRLTTQRQAIIDLFINNRGLHYSAEELYLALKAGQPEIGIATVYRSLDLLTKANVLRRLELGGERKVYELVDSNQTHAHHHLACLKCGKIFEFSEDLLEELEMKIQRQENFKIIDHSLQFYGFCSECQVDTES